LRNQRMRQVQVREFNAEGALQRSIVAAAARWWPAEINSPPFWSFYYGVETCYENGVSISSVGFKADETSKERKDYFQWNETPWDIIANSLKPEHMGVTELAAFLRSRGPIVSEAMQREFNTQLWHRLAYPWQGLALVLAVAPLCLQTSRRSSMLGASVGLGLFCVNLMLNLTSVNLGRGGWFSPHIAVWLPHVVAANLGLLVLVIKVEAPLLPSWRSSSEIRQWLRHFWRQLRGRRTRAWSGRVVRSDIRKLFEAE
jgi:lipopolysaccharide export system permease protein